MTECFTVEKAFAVVILRATQCHARAEAPFVVIVQHGPMLNRGKALDRVIVKDDQCEATVEAIALLILENDQAVGKAICP